MVTMHICLWLGYLVCAVGIRSSRDEQQQNQKPYVPAYSPYYYNEITEKLIESLSISKCYIAPLHRHAADSIGYNEKAGVLSHRSSQKADLRYEVKPPLKMVTQKWGTELKEVHRKERAYYQGNSDLCVSKQWKKLVSGEYRRAKGCFTEPMKTSYLERKNLKPDTIIINDYAATLHPTHRRCNYELGTGVCKGGTLLPGVGHRDALLVPLSERSFHRYPFLIHTNDAIISRSGMVGLECGPFGLFASCEAVKWGVPFAVNASKVAKDCTSRGCPYPMHEKIFVLTQYDDTQIGQFILEDLPKLIHNLDYLYANPDVKIHYGFTKKEVLPSWVVPHTYFHWLGLADRLINGSAFGKEVMIPREGGCQDVSYNAWEALGQREVLLQLSGVEDREDETITSAEMQSWFSSAVSNIRKSAKRSILIVRRTASKFTQNQSDHMVRRWPKGSLRIMVSLLKRLFPNHRIDIYSDSDVELMHNPSLQIKLFHSADVVIGVHGAGMTNTLYMRPGGVVVEVLPFFDSKHAPVVGIFPRLSSVVGLHHLSYFFTEFQLNATKLAEDVYTYVRALSEMD